MGIEELRTIKDESERVSAIYDIYNEDNRLNRSKAARVEFLTTVHYIEKFLKPGSRILDLGAGAGQYSLYFAEKGYSVTAIELAEANVKAFRGKIKNNMDIDLRQGNAMDLSAFKDESFDIVLMLGPLYHLEKEEDRQRCIHEAMRVCRRFGVMFFAFISNDMVILTELNYRPNFFIENTYDHETFKLEDFPFVFFTLEQCRKMLAKAGTHIIAEIGADGVSELMEEKINNMDEESYKQYIRYHFYCCQKPEMLGRSSHLLFIARR